MRRYGDSPLRDHDGHADGLRRACGSCSAIACSTSICRTTCRRRCARFLDRVRPRLAVIMETEIWPNLFMTASERGIPIVVANARLSEKSLRGYGPVRPLARRAIRCASLRRGAVASDARAPARARRATERLRRGRQPQVRHDACRPISSSAAANCARAGGPIGRSGSRRARTKAKNCAVMKAHARSAAPFPDALLLVAPRHPERFKALATAVPGFRIPHARRAARIAPRTDTQCFVIDTLGELLRFLCGRGCRVRRRQPRPDRRPQRARTRGARRARSSWGRTRSTSRKSPKT